jgi:prepilin-type N-terminal cleavage/methylation domain-containing protein/prepilin-type processing-associated H-X9-DG protein
MGYAGTNRAWSAPPASTGTAQMGRDCAHPAARKSFKNHHLPIINHPSSIINHTGFTLIELLVVISIVVLLMAILLPSLQRVRRQAKAVGCQANLRQAGVLYAIYASDNGGKAPWFSLSDKPGAISDPDLAHLTLFAGPSSDHRGLLLCPMASRPKEIPKAGCAFGETFSPWSFLITPELTRELRPGLCLSSYGINEWLTGPESPPIMWGEYNTNLRETPRVPFYLDSILWDTRLGYTPPPYEGCTSPEVGMNFSCINRHEGGVNCLFMDWSVRKVGLKELWTLNWNQGWDRAGPWTKRGGGKPEDWPEWMRGFKDY